MGTVLMKNEYCCIKRYWGGLKIGVCFIIEQRRSTTQDETKEIIKTLVDGLMVNGES
jgi:hypothetical protein